jgi:hypothetical protein
MLFLICRSAAHVRPEADIKSISCRFLMPLTIPTALAIRRRVVRSKTGAGPSETIMRFYAGSEERPMACIAETLLTGPRDGAGAT